MARAETLKDHLQQAEEKKTKKAIGVNGSGNGGKASKYVACTQFYSLN